MLLLAAVLMLASDCERAIDDAVERLAPTTHEGGPCAPIDPTCGQLQHAKPAPKATPAVADKQGLVECAKIAKQNCSRFEAARKLGKSESDAWRLAMNNCSAAPDVIPGGFFTCLCLKPPKPVKAGAIDPIPPRLDLPNLNVPSVDSSRK